MVVLQEGIRLMGYVKIKHIRNGKVIAEISGPNIIPDTALAAIAGLILNDVSVDDFDHVAVGIGSTSPVAGDTALESEITTGGGARKTATGTRITSSTTNDTAQLVVTFTFTATFAVTESGVFNASSGGDMLARQTFTAINVISGDSIEITWQVKGSR